MTNKHGAVGAMNDDVEAQMGCPICYTTTRYEEVGVVRPDGSTAPYPVYRCTQCYFHFVEPSDYPVGNKKVLRAV
jgi:transposase-like protein